MRVLVLADCQNYFMNVGDQEEMIRRSKGVDAVVRLIEEVEFGNHFIIHLSHGPKTLSNFEHLHRGKTPWLPWTLPQQSHNHPPYFVPDLYSLPYKGCQTGGFGQLQDEVTTTHTLVYETKANVGWHDRDRWNILSPWLARRRQVVGDPSGDLDIYMVGRKWRVRQMYRELLSLNIPRCHFAFVEDAIFPGPDFLDGGAINITGVEPPSLTVQDLKEAFSL